VLALTILGIMTSTALFGGLLLALRIVRGTWAGWHSAVEPVGEALREHR